MVKKCVRPRGRPRTFDESEAVLQAMKVFWLKGYDATTIDDLVEGMGVQRPSLYAIFGDKTTLFMRCLEEYVARGACAMQTQLCQPDIRQVISGILKSAVENATREGEHLGCMLASVAPLVDNDVIRDYIAQKGKESSAAVERRFQVGIDAGELPKNFPAAQRARQTLDIAAGLTIRARTGVSRDELLVDAEDASKLIIGLW